MILIIGATGKTGQELIKLIQSNDIPARALVRDATKAKQLHEQGMETVEGDMADPAALAQALTDIDKAFLLMANVEQQCELEKQFIDAAKAASVSHVVKLSAIGADSQSDATLKKTHGEAEDHLKESGMRYTMVQPNYFMQNMLHSAQSIIMENKFYLPMEEGKTGIIDIRDVAEVCLEALTDDKHQNKSYLITGPSNLSFSEVAEIFSDVLQREIQYVNIPLDDFREQLMNWGQSEWYVNAVLEGFAANIHGACEKVTDTFEEIMGKPPRTMKEFVQDYSSMFKS